MIEEAIKAGLERDRRKGDNSFLLLLIATTFAAMLGAFGLLIKHDEKLAQEDVAIKERVRTLEVRQAVLGSKHELTYE